MLKRLVLPCLALVVSACTATDTTGGSSSSASSSSSSSSSGVVSSSSNAPSSGSSSASVASSGSSSITTSSSVAMSSSSAAPALEGFTVLRGPGNALNAVADESAGPAAIVKLLDVGLSTEADDYAALQSSGNGVKLVGLGAADAALGTLPSSLEGHEYAMGALPAFGAKAPAIIVAPGVMSTGAGTLDVIVQAQTDSFEMPTQLYGTALAERPIAMPPVAGTPVAGNTIAGFGSNNMALVGNRYLYLRDDVGTVVHAYDLTTFTAGTGFQRIEARSFTPPMSPDFTPVLAGLTREANPVSGELAQAFAFSEGSGAGIYVIDPADGSSTTALLPATSDPSILVDIPAVRFSDDGTLLFVAWDAYSSETFEKVESDLLVYAFTNGAIVDSDMNAMGVQPHQRITLGDVHPTTIFMLEGHADEVGVVVAPYGGEAFLELYRFTSTTSERFARASLGEFSADSPSVDEIMLGQREILVVGTASGIQMYEVQR